MSLLGTLAKVAVGIAVAKGVGSLAQGSSSGDADAGGAGAGGILDSLTGGAQQGGGGGLGDMLGSVLGGQAGGSGGAAGGLGGLLEQLGGAGKASGGSGGGGLADILGGAAGGGLGDLLGGLAGKAPQTRESGGSFGDLLNSSILNGGEPEVAPSADEEAAAALMLRAMIQAAKSDGTLDDAERNNLQESLADSGPEEFEFVKRELAAPIDISGLAAQVPSGMEQQVYAMSATAIKLDEQSEAKYLHDLASAMSLDPATINGIHDQLGVQRIYS